MILNGAEVRLLSSGEFQTLNGSGVWVTIASNIVDARWSSASYDGGRIYLLPNTGANDTRVSFPPYTTTSQSSGGDWNDAIGNPSVWSQIAPTSAPTPPSGSSPTATQVTIETQLSMSGHKIVNGSEGTAPTDFIILSQLTALSQALTTVINAGDAATQANIDALGLVVANLPAGLTIEQVQAAINTSVAEAVLNEVIDDAQKQALVDAALSQLSTIDTAVIGRVGAAEAILVSLEDRVAALETLTTTHTAALDAGVAKDGSQDAAIATVASGLAAAVTVNDAQNVRLSNAESAAALVNDAITPVEVQVANGSVLSAIGVPLGDVSIDNSNTDHITVSIALGSSNAGKRRVSSAYRVIAGKEEKFIASEGRNGETYVFTYLKTRDGSSTVNLVLN